VIQQTLSAYLSVDRKQICLPPMAIDWTTIKRLTIVACGTAYYAGLVAKYWFECIARLPVEIDIASEFRYRQPPIPDQSVALFISQSGETADTLAAFHYAKAQGQYCIGIVNVGNSSLARSVDAPIMTHAGVEIGVASTKAFTTQLTVLALLALDIAYRRGHLSAEALANYCQDLMRIPGQISGILTEYERIQRLSTLIVKARDVLYLGRGSSFALAMEGALKLKEVSYIHAEGYAAGEMKHGPIALIDEHVPIIVIAPRDALFTKTVSNIEECVARKGQVIVFTDKAGAAELQGSTPLKHSLEVVVLPESNFLTSPLLYAVPIQLLAYDTAVLKGTDVDQPRNLAKSVTVE
jgi:glucosamine--fructose-6-phosphate aminotransferase (isomerizing)